VQLPEAGEDRKLVPEQRRVLASGLRAKAEEFKILIIYAVDEREPRQYAKQFAAVAEDAIGSKIIPREISGTMLTEVGLFVGVNDVNNPSTEAKDFMEILAKANLIAHYTLWSAQFSPDEQGVTFDLFVAKTSW
jgi:hypothetical protein